MRLIDADALLDSLTVDPIGCAGCPEPEFIDELIDILDTAPTVEPQGNLISRADAIEAKLEYRNEDMWDKEKSTYNKGWNDCNDAWVAIIKALPSADAEWIPCSERLPSESGTYLVTTAKGAVWADHFYANSVDDRHWSYRTRRVPIAWMPMPKPYKGGDTE